MKAIFVSVALLASTFSFAQSKTTSSTLSNTSFFAEVGGPGILFSANIDKRFKKSPLGLGGRIGLGFVNGDEWVYTSSGSYYYGERKSVVTIPIQLNYLFGKPNSVSAFEVGAGVTFTGKKLDIFGYRDTKKTNLYGTASFMYRRMPKDGGFSWRIGFTPIIGNGYIQASGGVSIGYNF
jgi:hypothetical protein